MSFTTDIYDEIRRILPNSSVRDFSEMCGRSSGYYGSITSQGVEISDDALMNLLIGLESIKRSGVITNLSAVSRIQKIISDELANRSSKYTNLGSGPVRRMIASAIIRLNEEKVYDQQPTPILF